MNFLLKKIFIDHRKGLSLRMMRTPRKWYHHYRSKKNRNIAPTIICNNCVAGVILHDLGLRFITPTINTLFYNFQDFYDFVQHLEYFSNANIFRVESKRYQYPVGGISFNGRTIKIGFVHYCSFEEAKNKWMERFKRINYDNVYVIYENRNVEEEELMLFSHIQYPKLVFSVFDKNKEKNYLFYKGHKLYRKWFPGKIFEYKGFFSLKRYLDDFGYISFLNSGREI